METSSGAAIGLRRRRALAMRGGDVKVHRLGFGAIAGFEFEGGEIETKDEQCSQSRLTGGDNDQVDRCCICFGRRNLRPGNVARAASSGGRHDHASPSGMWRGDEVE